MNACGHPDVDDLSAIQFYISTMTDISIIYVIFYVEVILVVFDMVLRMT